MFSTKRIAIGLPLLVVSAIAGEIVYSSKVAGDMVAAHWDSPVTSGITGVVDVTPADGVDARAYLVNWQGCDMSWGVERRLCLWASGLVPRSAVKTRSVGAVGLELDVSMLSVVISKGGEDCRSGTCVPLFPMSVPLKGTFTIYGGPGSSSEDTNGNVRRQNITPYGGITVTESFFGSRTQYSAVFGGVVGPITVPPPSLGSNATITFMKGQKTVQVVSSVYPPAL